MKFGITTQIVGLALFLVVAIVLTLGTASVNENRTVVRELMQEKLPNETTEALLRFQYDIETLRDDVDKLSDLDEVNEYVKRHALATGYATAEEFDGGAQAGSRTSDGDGEASPAELLESARRRARELFATRMSTRKTYIQVRYLDWTGMEQIRVDRAKAGDKIDVVPDDRLQNKSNADYFQDCRDNLTQGEFYLSKIQLNREGADRVVQEPRVPVLRGAVPIYLRAENSKLLSGKFLGVIIVNLDLGPQFERFRSVSSRNNRIPYVTNHEDYFLVHPAGQSREFAFEFPDLKNTAECRVSDAFPDLSVPGPSDHTSEDRAFDIPIADGTGLAHYRVLHYDQRNPDRYIGVMVAARPGVVLEKADGFRKNVLLWACGLLLAGGLLAFALSGLITGPLRRITHATASFAEQGRYEEELPVSSGTEIGQLARTFQTMATRVSERDAELRELNQDLENRVRERTKRLDELNRELASNNLDLEDARAEAEQSAQKAADANTAKTQFLGFINHEVRNALNAVINYSEMLLEEAEEAELDDFQEDLGKINTVGKHLQALINDVLDLQKIEEGRLEISPETFDLRTMLDETVTTARPLVEKKGNELVLDFADELGSMHSDEMRLRQCLLNLLSNAGKFTENGQVKLTVRRQKVDGESGTTANTSDGNRIVFDISDTGIGMSEEQLSRLFTSYTQAHASIAKKYGGTGLGLSISRQIARLLGGDIRVTSEIDVGSTFTMNVPAITDEAAARAAASVEETVAETIAAVPPRQDGRANAVLVVDDDENVCDLIRRFLEKEGFEVRAVNRGRDVVATAKEFRPSAITLDVLMPDVDGWDVLKELKADPATRDIPVIMVTISDDRELGVSLGMADYLTKPLDRDSLLRSLRPWCNVQAPGSALICEDDPTSRELLRRMLERDQWTVMEAANGREALERIAEHCPSLILLDLQMPEMDGFELIEELRRHPQWENIPVIVITARDLSEADRMFLSGSLFLSGCVKRVLQKGSFDRDELLHEIRRVIPEKGDGE